MAGETKERVVLVDQKTLSREQTAEEMKQLRKNPPDKAKRPGGYFLRLDGTARDANGKRIPIDPADLEQIKQLRAIKGLPPLGKKPKARDDEPDLDAGTDAALPEAEEPQEEVPEDAPVEAAPRRSRAKKK